MIKTKGVVTLSRSKKQKKILLKDKQFERKLPPEAQIQLFNLGKTLGNVIRQNLKTFRGYELQPNNRD